MGDEFYKFLSITVTALGGIVTTVFAYLSLRESQKNSKKIDVTKEKVEITEKKVDVLHESVNGKITQLLEVSKVADTKTGKEQGIAQEKSEQADRDKK